MSTHREAVRSILAFQPSPARSRLLNANRLGRRIVDTILEHANGVSPYEPTERRARVEPKADTGGEE